MKLTTRTLNDRVDSEADAYELLEELRWHGTPVCPFCGHDKAYFLTPKNGTSRATGPKKTMSVRRVWKCAKCRKQFSVLTNTIMHGTKIPIQTWLSVLVDVSSAKNGMSAREVERKYEVTAETAWHMLHRIREAMKRDPLAGLLSGTIIADETWIGGKPGNRHVGKRFTQNNYLKDDKTAVLSVVDRETGEVRSQVVPNVRGKTLKAALQSQVDLPRTTLHTDTARAYASIGKSAAGHEMVNHTMSEYVRGNVTTNHAEGFFSQLKRSIDGTHHHVSVEHLHRYLAEFDFRYSTCKMTDSDRALRIIDQGNGRRLSYRPLTGPA